MGEWPNEGARAIVRVSRDEGWFRGLCWARGWDGGAFGREFAPAGDLLFLLAQEKQAKEVHPTGRGPAGSLRCSCSGRRCRTHFALTALRSNSGGESEHDAGMLRCPPAPRPALLGTARRGLKSTHGPSLRSAARSAPPLRAAQQARSKGRGAGHSGTPWSGSPRPPALSPRGKARQRLRGEIIHYGCCV